MTNIEELLRRLRERLVARLAVRWPEAHAYIPQSSFRILCASPMAEHDQAQLEIYMLAYQDAMGDMASFLANETEDDETPLSVLMAEGSVFQGGTHPPSIKKTARQKRKSHPKISPPPGQRRWSAARMALEALFEKKGGGDGV